MTLVFAVVAAVLFGTGAYLLLSHDLLRVVLGVVLVSHSAILTLIASSVTRGTAPIYPLPDRPVHDPLTQAMALTAIVIGLAVTSLLLVLIVRVVHAYHTQELVELAEAEAEQEVQAEREDLRQHEDEEAAAR